MRSATFVSILSVLLATVAAQSDNSTSGLSSSDLSDFGSVDTTTPSCALPCESITNSSSCLTNATSSQQSDDSSDDGSSAEAECLCNDNATMTKLATCLGKNCGADIATNVTTVLSLGCSIVGANFDEDSFDKAIKNANSTGGKSAAAVGYGPNMGMTVTFGTLAIAAVLGPS